MVAFDEAVFSSSCHSLFTSLDPKPTIEWVTTLQEAQAQIAAGNLYDVMVFDCRKAGVEWGPFSELIQEKNNAVILGIMKVSENAHAQDKIIEDGIGFRVDERMAPTVLKWLLRQAQERKQLVVEKEQLRSELGEAAYKMEMADVASTVLHNVGNVLTSVTVAAHMVESVVDQSPVTLVNRMAELITTHQQDLGTYLMEDPKGKRIPPSLEKIGSHLVEEQQKVLNEMKGLVRNIRHMKQIILSHQTMAKSAGQAEQIALADVLSHAMELSFQPGDARWMTIHRDYQEVPTVLVDQHQLLQILVNLLRNAKQAMRQQARDSHELRLGVNYQDNEKIAVVMTIQDSGVGIAPENLTKMFTRGFTTKKDGNGIGLHSSIAAIQAMGGSMHVHSDGLGCGAIFTLTFPVQQEVVFS
jgi:signal transduction histidine kinase